MKGKHQQSQRKEDYYFFFTSFILFPTLEQPFLLLLKISIVSPLPKLSQLLLLTSRFSAFSSLPQQAHLLVPSVTFYLCVDNSKSISLAPSETHFCPTCQTHNLTSCVLTPPSPSLYWVSPWPLPPVSITTTSTSPDWSFRSLLLPLLILSPLLHSTWNHNLCGRLNGWNSLAVRKSGKRNVYCSSFQTLLIIMHREKYILYHDSARTTHIHPPNFHESLGTLISRDTV